MGLTISYELRSNASDLATARDLVRTLRTCARKLPFEDVGRVKVLTGPRTDPARSGNDDRLGWLLTQAKKRVWVVNDKGHLRHARPDDLACTIISVPPVQLIAFSAWPGEGCEDANFGLARYPKREPHTGLAISGSPWSWKSFCKTQYANDPRSGGPANFLKCHLAVVALLDEAKKLGILDHVTDESEYWEARDPHALVREVGEWDKYVASVVGALKDRTGGDGVCLESPILRRSDFERLEAEGVSDPTTAKVAELIRRTHRPRRSA